MQKSTKSHYAKDVRGSRSPVSERLPSSPVSWRGLQGGSAPWKPSTRCKFYVMSQPSKRRFRNDMARFPTIPGWQNTRLASEEQKNRQRDTRTEEARHEDRENKGTRGSRRCICGQPQMNLRLPAADESAAKFRSKTLRHFRSRSQREKEKKKQKAERKKEKKKMKKKRKK